MGPLLSFDDIPALANLASSLRNSILWGWRLDQFVSTPGPMRGSWRKVGWGLFKKDEMRILKTHLMDQKIMVFTMSHCTTLERVEKATKHHQATLSAMQYSIHQLLRALGYIREGGNNHRVIWFIDAVGNKLSILIERKPRSKAIPASISRTAQGWDDLQHGEVCPSCQRAVSMQDASGFTWSRSARRPCATTSICKTSFLSEPPLRPRYSPSQRVSYWDSLGTTIYAVIKDFGLMAQKGTTVYNVRRELDGPQMCLASVQRVPGLHFQATLLRPV
ncbi:hypothetical protein DFH09DRAFT_1316273 [Mycena vulgaris]|nr:hypothetical protein DFH09DRAFT_1316273 [Mycena vulgaris]